MSRLETRPKAFAISRGLVDSISKSAMRGLGKQKVEKSGPVFVAKLCRKVGTMGTIYVFRWARRIQMVASTSQECPGLLVVRQIY